MARPVSVLSVTDERFKARGTMQQPLDYAFHALWQRRGMGCVVRAVMAHLVPTTSQLSLRSLFASAQTTLMGGA
jgi:hypothetical protein